MLCKMIHLHTHSYKKNYDTHWWHEKVNTKAQKLVKNIVAMNTNNEIFIHKESQKKKKNHVIMLTMKQIPTERETD
jgi:hypothetical protein